MKTHSEYPLPKGMADALRGEVEHGLTLLGVTADDTPGKIVAAVDEFVFGWQCGERPPADALAPDNAPLPLGAVWGQQLVRAFGWDWAVVEFHEHDNSQAPGVLSPDRALAVYPIHFIMGCLHDPTVDTTILLAFNMLEAGTIGPTQPGGFFNLMDGVQRIIPRVATPKK